MEVYVALVAGMSLWSVVCFYVVASNDWSDVFAPFATLVGYVVMIQELFGVNTATTGEPWAKWTEWTFTNFGFIGLAAAAAGAWWGYTKGKSSRGAA